MKKILGLTLAAVLVLAMVAGGTWAYFSDTETATASLAAGTLDLDVNDLDTAQVLFNVSDKGPGESGTSDVVTLKNSGNLTGELDISIGLVNQTASAGPTEWEDASTDLGGVALMAMFIDVDAGGTWTSGDICLKNDDTTYAFSAATTGTATGGSTTTVVDSGASWTVDQFTGLPVTVTGKGTRVVISNTPTTLTVATPFTAAVSTDAYSIASGPHYSLITNYASGSWGGTSGIESMSPSAADGFYVQWDIPATAGNNIQGDGLDFTVTFTLAQAGAD